MNHLITLTEASEMTAFYRQNREGILAALYQGQNVLPISETFDREDFDALLGQAGCTGVRIYYGMDADYKVHAVIVGVTAANEDLLPSTGASLVSEEDIILEKGSRCPDICAEVSPLNT
ncbi:MAG: hypothetical protein ACTHMD_06780 [Flavisolibacter sp.]